MKVYFEPVEAIIKGRVGRRLANDYKGNYSRAKNDAQEDRLYALCDTGTEILAICVDDPVVWTTLYTEKYRKGLLRTFTVYALTDSECA